MDTPSSHLFLWPRNRLMFSFFDSVFDPVDSAPDPVGPVLEPIDSIDSVEPVFEHISACCPSGKYIPLVIVSLA